MTGALVGEVLTDAEIKARKAAAERHQDNDYLTGIYPDTED